MDKRDKYMIKNLQSITKASGLCSNIQIYLKEEAGSGLLIKYKVGTIGYVIFYVVPDQEESSVGIDEIKHRNESGDENVLIEALNTKDIEGKKSEIDYFDKTNLFSDDDFNIGDDNYMMFENDSKNKKNDKMNQ
jgi:hypothetical protein